MLSRMIIHSKFFLAVLIVLGAMSFARVSIDRASIDEVRVVGTLSEGQLMNIREHLSSMDAAVSDADEIRDVLEELDWVNGVNVRKSWPAAISVEVIPETIIAYWNDDGFISEQGQVVVTDLLVGGDLPLLYGPEGSEFEVMLQFQQLNRMLNAHGHDIRILKRSERGSWSLVTRDRLQVLLGKEDLKARMQRFLRVTGEIEEIRKVARIDARYINGVAVEFNEDNQLDLADLTQSVGEESL